METQFTYHFFDGNELVAVTRDSLTIGLMIALGYKWFAVK